MKLSKDLFRFRREDATRYWKSAKRNVKKLWPNLTNLFWWLGGIVCGAFINHAIESYLNRDKEDLYVARYNVENMPAQCKAKSSIELDQRIKDFVESMRRARANGKGIPVWREDCSIGAQFSLDFKERLDMNESVTVPGSRLGGR
jgi:hypothetical protein